MPTCVTPKSYSPYVSRFGVMFWWAWNCFFYVSQAPFSYQHTSGDSVDCATLHFVLYLLHSLFTYQQFSYRHRRATQNNAMQLIWNVLVLAVGFRLCCCSFCYPEVWFGGLWSGILYFCLIRVRRWRLMADVSNLGNSHIVKHAHAKI